MDKKTAGIKKIAKLMGNAACALSILFILAALARTEFDFSKVTDWRAFLAAFAAGTVLKTATVFMSGCAWCAWLEFFAKRRCSRKEALNVYAKANIGKYLPGNMMHYVERNLFAGKLALSQKQIAAASLSEVISLVLAACLTGVVLSFSQMREVFCTLPYIQGLLKRIPSDAGSGSFQAGGTLWAASAFLVLFAVSAAFLVKYCRRKWKPGMARAFLKTFAVSVSIYTAVLAILGMILVLLYWYLGGRPRFGQALQMMAAYSIAWVLGFVVPGAPGGIGVREMALTLLLAPITGRDPIVVLSVLHRLVTVAGDFAAYLLRIKLTGSRRHGPDE